MTAGHQCYIFLLTLFDGSRLEEVTAATKGCKVSYKIHVDMEDGEVKSADKQDGKSDKKGKKSLKA